ncbi:unnamed protein product [Arabidopsis halleri]
MSGMNKLSVKLRLVVLSFFQIKSNNIYHKAKNLCVKRKFYLKKRKFKSLMSWSEV